MFRANATLLIDLLVIMGLLVTLCVCAEVTFADETKAIPPKENQSREVTREKPSKPGIPHAKSPAGSKACPTKKKDKAGVAKTPTQQPAVSTKPTAPGSQHATRNTQHATRTKHHPAQTAATKYHGTFVEALKSAPFPYSGKDADPNFFDFVDLQTGERYRTTRTWERLSEKDHYRDSSVLFHVPSQFNPNKPFTYVVFFHGNRTEVRQCVKEYRLDDQIDSSGRNVILVLPQLAKNAADSSPGSFAKKNAFKAFMQEAARVLSSKMGKKYQQQLEHAPIVLAAFSGGYKPLACTLDRGGIDSRIKGVLLMDGLYEDLYIFGRWLLHHLSGTFFVSIFTEGSTCEEKTGMLAQFLREHRLPFKEEWPKGVKKGQICLVRSPFDHMQVPVEGPPRQPLAELLRSQKN